MDFNGTNNLDTWHSVQSSINRMGGAHGLKNVRYRNIKFKDAAGAHFLYLSNGSDTAQVVEQVSVSQCIFENCGGAITGNLTTDHSSIYFDINNGTVENNIFTMSNTDDTIATAIETHGSDVVCSGNTIYGYNKAFNLGGDARNASNVVVEGNTARQVNEFVTLWTAGTYVYRNILIDGNILELRESTGINSIGINAPAACMASSVYGSGLTITNNIIVGPDNPTLTGYAHMGVNIYKWNDILISGNQISRFVREGIGVWNDAGTETIKNVNISNNQLRSCGFTTTAANKRGIVIVAGATPGTDDINYLSIQNNQILCDAPYGTVASWGITFNVTGSFTSVLEKNNMIVGAGVSPTVNKPSQHVLGIEQVTPTAETTGAVSLTIAKLLTKLITAAPSDARAYTLDTGANCEAGAAFSINDSFDWVLINTESAAADHIITLTASSGHTIIGNPLVLPSEATTVHNSSAIFRTRKTALNTFVTYRIA
jgi:hypothetical protein